MNSFFPERISASRPDEAPDLSVFGFSVLFFLMFFLGGCSHAPPIPQSSPTVSYRPAPVQPSAGAIYTAGSGFALFEDTKARVAGDLLTVLLVERTQAQKRAALSTSKDSAVSFANPQLFGRPLTAGGIGIGEVGVDQSRDFDGGGDASQSNQLSGSITVTVVERLPNGNLVVIGEKSVGLNQGTERVRLTGVVRPVDITPENSITSDRVADARIEYVGSGALADASAQGWLARFFNSPWYPF